jgi:two-component system OmpR family sensor kinase
MIEALDLCKENGRELKRIEIASKTLSKIYEDLTYLNLNHEYHRDITKIDMGELVRERVVYFEAMAKSKMIDMKLNIKDRVVLEIDRNDALRLIDNLLSNAIKYNKIKGAVDVEVSKKHLIVSDSGVGIKIGDIKLVKKRFKRADMSEGGFGIGLDIVSKVVESYGYEFELISEEKAGTKAVIRWQK